MRRKTLLWGIGGVVFAEVVAIAAGLWPLVLFGGGLAALVAIVAFVVDLMREDAEDARLRTFDGDEALAHWRVKTEVLVAWSDGTAADWDRHIRPIVSREFQLAIGHRPDRARGEFVFGPWWVWVDPFGHGPRSEGTGSQDPGSRGPGREGLNEILRRLEWITTGEAAA